MSRQQASSELAPSKLQEGPKPGDQVFTVETNPLKLAVMAQKAIYAHQEAIRIEALLIRQLLLGRHVRCLTRNMVFLITEVRVGLAGKATLWGKRKGMRNKGHIGTLETVELYEPGAKP